MKTRDFFRYAARPFNIFILLCILVFIIVFLEMMSAVVLRALTPPVSLSESEIRQLEFQRSSKMFTPDGKVFLIGRVANGIAGVYDANCTKIGELTKEGLRKYLEWTEALERNPDFIHSGFILQTSEAFTVVYNKDADEAWKYVPDKEVFVGYGAEDNIIGYLGINGFSQTQAGIKPFGRPKSASNTIDILENQEKHILLWQTEKRFFAIDFKNRKVETIIDGGDANISDIQTHNWSYDGKEPIDANYRTLVKYCTEDGNTHLILNQPDEKITVKMPQQWNNYLPNKVKVTATKDAIFLSHETSDILKPVDYDKSHKIRKEFNDTLWTKDANFSAELYKVDSAGNLNLVNEFKWTNPGHAPPVYKDEKYYLGYTSVISPSIFYVANKFIINHATDINAMFPRQEMIQGYVRLIANFYPRNLAVCIVLSVVMMMFALWHGWSRKNNRLSLALWVILVGLFNIAGLLTYLALNHTTLLKCSACGKQRNLEKPACIHCGAGLPLPSASMVRIK